MADAKVEPATDEDIARWRLTHCERRLVARIGAEKARADKAESLVQQYCTYVDSLENLEHRLAESAEEVARLRHDYAELRDWLRKMGA